MTAMLLTVFGGLAIFIFGMKTMSDGLQRVAGERMRGILRLFSANRLVAILSGTAVTAVIQSSSASTVMVIGFVNAGLLNLLQATGIIFGANIGTTVTAQLVAFDVSWIVMPAIIIGLLASFAPRPSISGWGETIIGLGFLFLGMEFMSDELKQLAGHPEFMRAFQLFDCSPVNGSLPVGALFGAIGVGLVATLIIQSSSACSGVVIALGASGLIDIYTAVALVLGSNIGTTVTAQLAAIPANRVAKQAALAHTLFNFIGVTLICLSFWLLPSWGDCPAFFHLVDCISGSGDLPRRIANAHTLFNVATTLVLTPFIPLLARTCETLIPAGRGKVRFVKLEPHLLDTPEIALFQSVSALRKMLKKAWRMVDCALVSCAGDAPKKQRRLKQLAAQEEQVDAFQHDITSYLSQLMCRPLTPAQAAKIPKLIHCTNDAERIGDHTANICKLAAGVAATEAGLSESATAEFRELHSQLGEQAAVTLEILETGSSPELGQRAVELENSIRRHCDECEKNSMKRHGAKTCTPQTGLLFIELISEIGIISRHLANIAERAGDCRGETGRAEENA
ncbi:MAG: Na/Pi cotransporter family protein [Victivallaceae bacterium]|nr:Na/Pi cotransporter family protein [Victivallaceae bacterium]